ncbi:cytochrome P450 [Mycena maculata]|uniref:Cytochrome P450 n=1 Tax=Mycena maculata TaxID=230809 RepID=A0AAD7NVD9_9AGAR|nr:cytochrome P450 [Mycena maculata]
MATVTIVVALLLLVQGTWILLRRVFSVLDNIPGPSPKSFITGNLTQYHDPDGCEFQQDIEENYGQVVKLHGLFAERELFVFDPAALHSILVKDQDIYPEMPKFMSMNYLLQGNGIFSTIGDYHRKFRKIMMPAFSTANLRGMVPLFYDVAERARDGLISPRLLDGPQTLDFNSILCRISLELIGQAGIGYSFDPMLPRQVQTDQYARSLKDLMPTVFKLALWLPFLPYILRIPFPAFRRWMINIIPSPALCHLRDLVDFTDGIAIQLVKERKAAIENGQLDLKDNAKDVMSLLMKGNMTAQGELHLTDDELVASTSMIVFAGTDTTSTALNRLFHILAMYPDVQDKLRAEILTVPAQADHDTVVALPYLDAVVREILRLYPPVSPGMYREAVEHTVLPLSTPITGKDGVVLDSITVPKGTTIYIAIAAANHNKQIWGDDALEFRPERWISGKAASPEMKQCGVYGNMLTFLGGGRSCIGFKFAQLELKVVACVFLRAFKISTPDPRVKWRMAGTVGSPNIDNKAELPILVERLEV